MDDFQFEIARFLAANASKGRRTTYPEVAVAVNWTHDKGRGLGSHLYEILHYCHGQGLPPLTTILVQKGKQEPPEDAMEYIQEVLGRIDIGSAQSSVFAFNWASISEFRSIGDTLPGGADIWKTSFKRPSVTFPEVFTNSFLLKFNGLQHGPKHIARPGQLSDWENEVLAMPWSGARPSSFSNLTPGPEIKTGDVLYLWAHEDQDYGNGYGLTGIAIAKGVAVQEGIRSIQLSNLALLNSPFGFKDIEGDGWQSKILDLVHSDRSPRAWVMSVDERQSLDILIAKWGRRKTVAVKNAENRYLSVLEAALHEQKEEVGEADRERKTAAAKARPGQQRFRTEAMMRHGGQCVVTGTRIAEVLEAAHVIPHTGHSAFEVPENSLVLRRDVHALFDAGLIAVHPTSGQMLISESLKTSGYAKLAKKVVDHKLAPEPLRYQHAKFRKIAEGQT